MSDQTTSAASEPASGRAYWRSLNELADSPEFTRFVEKQFPNFAPAMLSTRRSFLRLMGASLALGGMTGLTGCIRWPAEKIVPFARRPEGRIPGIPVTYASAFEVGGVSRPVLVTSYEGRPIKIEGNPEHPMSRGAASGTTQASVLELYDPHRLKTVIDPQGQTWMWLPRETAPESVSEEQKLQNDRVTALFQSLGAEGGRGLAILMEATSSPGVQALKEAAKRRLPGARWYEYEPISRDNERDGARLIWGQPYRAQHFAKEARVIVSFDADLLMTHPAALAFARDFAEVRRGEGDHMNQLHVVESTLSVTGGMADHRYPVASSRIPAAVAHLAHLLRMKGLELTPELASAVGAFSAPPAGVSQKLARQLQQLADVLLANRGRSLLAAGPRQPAEVHALTQALNHALGNVGATVRFIAEPEPERPSHAEALQSFVADVNRAQDRVNRVLILGGNPVFDAPADVDVAGALGRADVEAVHLTLFENETSERCGWKLPRAHYLEAWGDGRSYDGTHTLAQPLIAPLYGGRSMIEVLSLLIEETPRGGRDLLKGTFAALHGDGPDLESRFRRALHDGFVDTSAPAAVTVTPRRGWESRLARHTSAPLQFEVVFAEDHSVYDGRFHRNVWLQEMPDPITKLAWDNAALVSPATAARLGVSDGDFLSVKVDGKELAIPAFVLPGHADDSVTIPLGYRGPGNKFPLKTYLEESDGGGFNAYLLRSRGAFENAGVAADVQRGNGSYELATTQDHHPIDNVPGRELEKRAFGQVTEGEGPAQERKRDTTHALIRTLTFDEHKHRGAGHGPEEPSGDDSGHGGAHGSSFKWDSLFPDKKYEGHQWAMSIDLSACTGCSACVVACQAENNVPVVGKEELAYGREMHWLRVDRYFRRRDDAKAPNSMDAEDLELGHQPMPCQQCENAPCEQVCPVGATMHSEEGLNDMVYNRCIGTRYCSNNCPFKVRRFNYFNNFKHVDDVEAMLHNPEVTIRNRGVMEKCTYCVQRISRGKIEARNENRPVQDGEITPACAQTCPTQAIVFGDLSDPNSRVAKLQASARSYTLLDVLNIKPRTHYLEKIVNPMVEGS